MDLGQRMKKVRLKRGITLLEIANKLQKTEATIQRYESGNIKNLKADTIEDLADVLKVPPAYLMGWITENEVPDLVSEYHYMPTSISAGLPIDVEAVTNAETIQIPDSIMGKWAGDEEIFFSKINGDSMDRIIPDKSLIAIKPIEKETLKNGDIVVFSNEHDYSVKYYYRQPDKLIFKPHSYNIEHHEQHYSLTDNITIHGKVVLYIVEMD